MIIVIMQELFCDLQSLKKHTQQALLNQVKTKAIEAGIPKLRIEEAG